MKVNVNGLRLHMSGSLKSLIKKLNRSIDEDGNVYIAASGIQEELDGLRSTVGGFCCMYDDQDEMFSEMSNVADSIPWFNEAPEDMEGNG